jgi:hypothetical protein
MKQRKFFGLKILEDLTKNIQSFRIPNILPTLEFRLKGERTIFHFKFAK